MTATAHTATYDSRGRLLTIYDAVTSGSPYSLALTYANGLVASANDSVNGNWSSFQYDDFNRLQTSWCSANCPNLTNAEGFTYTYDQFGNRWTQTLYSGSGPGPQPNYSFDGNNRISGTDCTHGATHFCYDSAGNLLYDGLGNSSFYDSEGREILSGPSNTTYTYDGLGQRVQRNVNGTVYDYVFDNQGHENNKATGGFAASAWSELYFGGMHVSTYTNSSTYFSHADHLGSERTETDPSGSDLSGASVRAFTSLPFGEWTSNAFESELGFTGDLLDNPDGNTFHTPNRQYNQTQGRWMRPDPAGLAAVDPTNPQSWNRYAYVGNNPLSFVDPSGLERAAPCGGVWSNGDCQDGGGGFGCNPIDPGCLTFCDAWYDPLCDSPFSPGGGGIGSPGGGTPSGGNPPGGGMGSPGSSQAPWQEWGTPNGLPPGFGGAPGFGCDFGNVCNPIGNDFVSGVTGAGTPDSPFTINVLVLAPYLHLCGDFFCDQNANQVGLAPPYVRGLSEDSNFELSWVLGPWYLARINSNPILRMGPGYVKGGKQIFRIVSGGPGLPWWWHIWNGPTWPF